MIAYGSNALKKAYRTLVEHDYAQQLQAALMTLNWTLLDPLLFQDYVFFFLPATWVPLGWLCYSFSQMMLCVLTFLSLRRALIHDAIPKSAADLKTPHWYIGLHVANALNSTFKSMRALMLFQRLKSWTSETLSYVIFFFVSVNMLWVQCRIAFLRASKPFWAMDRRLHHMLYNGLRATVTFLSMYTLGMELLGNPTSLPIQWLCGTASLCFAILVPTTKTVEDLGPFRLEPIFGDAQELCLIGFLYTALWMASLSNTFFLTTLLMKEFIRIRTVHRSIALLPISVKYVATTTLGLSVAWSIHEQQHVHLAHGTKILHHTLSGQLPHPRSL